jgi:enterochelin esterase-like enzyme
VILSRRQVVISALAVGVAGGTLVAEGLAFRRFVDRFFDLATQPPYTLPSTDAAVESGSFVSRARAGRTVRWSIAYPPGERRGLPVVIVLHGRGDSHATVFDSHAWGRYLVAAVAGGTAPFAVAAADGGDHTYWHRRANSDDPQLMLLTEFVPLLAQRGLRTDRFGLAGWSMGGYGALLLAERIGPSRCAAVAVDSPALWRKPSDTAPGAFDNAADFRHHDVIADRARLSGIPLRIAIGTSDPFYETTRALASELTPPPETDFSVGGHTVAFWRHSAPQQIAFLGEHLSGSG